MNRTKTTTVKTATNGITNYTYNAADVTATATPAPTGENTKTVQQEFNGLGWLMSTCAGTSSLSGNGSCGQSVALNGYLTQYTRDSLGRPTKIARNKQAGATEVDSLFSYDMENRVIQQTLPESGTFSAVFDSAVGNCAAAAGNMTQSTDANGNVICFA
jgi:hypothetical protein